MSDLLLSKTLVAFLLLTTRNKTVTIAKISNSLKKIVTTHLLKITSIILNKAQSLLLILIPIEKAIFHLHLLNIERERKRKNKYFKLFYIYFLLGKIIFIYLNLFNFYEKCLLYLR
jgi:hypothetical protein